MNRGVLFLRAAGPDITVDFGSRANLALPIPAGMFGAGFGQVTQVNSAAQTLLLQAGIAMTRFDSQLPAVFPNPPPAQPNWNPLDTLVSAAATAGFHPLVIMDYTPAWLQPNPNPCDLVPTAPSHAPPTHDDQWAGIAALVVQHLDAHFPGVVQDYEIWNEPDGPSFLCAPDDATRLADYLALYAAAAKAMKQQAQTDGAQVRIGGPTLANPSGHATTWLSQFLTNPGIAPYVDFVSYHDYMAGGGQAGTFTWDTSNPSLDSITQNPASGVEAIYKRIAALVRAGNQPLGASTPIYVTEYNTNSGPQLDCCRNDATYGSLWNSLFVADLLSAVYAGAPQVPTHLLYFTSSKPETGYCLYGGPDSMNSCGYSSGDAIHAYPQYYAYLLLSGANYLNLLNGGYLATSVSSSPTGLVVVGFFTASADNIFIVNPTSSQYPALTVLAQNAALPSVTGAYFLLNSANPQITTQALPLTPSGNGYAATIAVPAYSTAAISIATHFAYLPLILR